MWEINYSHSETIIRDMWVALVVKNPPANAGDLRDTGLIPGSGIFPWRRASQPTPVVLPGESHGQRSLADYIQSMGSWRVWHD